MRLRTTSSQKYSYNKHEEVFPSLQKTKQNQTKPNKPRKPVQPLLQLTTLRVVDVNAASVWNAG